MNGQSTFNALINANAGITLGGTNTDPVTITKNNIGFNVSELALMLVNWLYVLVMMVVEILLHYL